MFGVCGDMCALFVMASYFFDTANIQREKAKVKNKVFF